MLASQRAEGSRGSVSSSGSTLRERTNEQGLNANVKVKNQQTDKIYALPEVWLGRLPLHQAALPPQIYGPDEGHGRTAAAAAIEAKTVDTRRLTSMR